MGLRLVRHRTRESGEASWSLVRGDRALALEGRFATTGELLGSGVAAARALAAGTDERSGVPLAELEILSPVTHPCRLIALGMNYRAHATEIGLSEAPPLTLFRKSSASICGPRDAIEKPDFVRLLDYEVELGLVIGRATRGPLAVSAQNLHEIVGALVVGNDVSARDVQVAEGQFYRAKSFRTFTPTGPSLFVPDPAELARWRELRLTLRVNGELRQDAACGEMIHDPAHALTEITRIEDLDPGDLVLTGTPGGVALRPPPALVQRFAGLLPEARRFALFLAGQKRRREYLRPGDRVGATIRTPDGAIDLGEQDNLVR